MATLEKGLYRFDGSSWKSRGRSAISAIADFTSFSSGTKPLGPRDGALGVQNVGVHPSIALTTVAGDYTMTAGETIEALDIQGVLRTAAGCTVRHTRVWGRGGTTSEIPMVQPVSGFDHGGTLFEFCQIGYKAGGHTSPWQDNIRGQGYHARYCVFEDGVDGLHGASVDATTLVELSRFYYPYYFSWWNKSSNVIRTAGFTDYGGVFRASPFPAQSTGDCHSDGAQPIRAGWTIQDNFVGGDRGSSAALSHLDPTDATDYATMMASYEAGDYTTSCVLISSEGSAHPTGVLYQRNWLRGSAGKVQLITSGGDDLSGVSILNNIFEVSSPDYGYQIYRKTGCNATISGNVKSTGGAATITDF